MKKLSKEQPAMKTTKDKPGMTVGIDLGDRYNRANGLSNGFRALAPVPAASRAGCPRSRF